MFCFIAEAIEFNRCGECDKNNWNHKIVTIFIWTIFLFISSVDEYERGNPAIEWWPRKYLKTNFFFDETKEKMQNCIKMETYQLQIVLWYATIPSNNNESNHRKNSIYLTQIKCEKLLAAITYMKANLTNVRVHVHWPQLNFTTNLIENILIFTNQYSNNKFKS